MASLLIAIGYALIVVVLRTPILSATPFAYHAFGAFLATHVALSFHCWFAMVLAMYWARECDCPRWCQTVAIASMSGGALALAIAPWLDHDGTVLRHYLPAILSPVFRLGFVLLVLGGLTVLPFPWRRPRSGEAFRSSRDIEARLIALPVWVGGVLAGFLALHELASGDEIVWALFHVLPFSLVGWLAAHWLDCAEIDGHRRRMVVAASTLPCLASLPATLLLAAEARAAFFSSLMQWTMWWGPVIALGLIAFVRRTYRARPVTNPASSLRVSSILFGIGCCLGLLIREDSLMVPAHYHAMVAALTAAMLVHLLVKAEGISSRRLDWAGVQRGLAVYGGSSALLALALAGASLYAPGRKVHYFQLVEPDMGYLVMIAFAAGGAAVAAWSAGRLALGALRLSFYSTDSSEQT